MGDSRRVSLGAAVRRDIGRKVKQEGILGMLMHVTRKLGRDLRKAITRPPGDAFDSRYKTDTARMISVGALDIPDQMLAHSNRYEAVIPADFFRLIERLPIEPERFVFVDIGSGKGRALLLASKFPFLEIIGVEHSATLTEVAARNIRVFKDEMQRCRRISAVCQDATTYDVPNCNVVMYLHNPFDEELMQAMVRCAERSLLANPRDMFIVYHRPVHRSVWDASRVFTLLHSTAGHAIYRAGSSGVSR